MKLATIVAVVASALLLASSATASTLYAPKYFSPEDMVSSYGVGDDGSLTPVAGSPFTIGTGATRGLGSIALAPDGVRGAAGFYFVGGIQGLAFSQAGGVAPAQAVLGSAQGGIVAVSPDGRFVYQSTGGATKGVAAYSIDGAGSLTALAGSPFFNATDLWGLAVSPGGKFLYATENNAIRPFSVAADGSLTALPAKPLVGVDTIQFAPDGKHLIASTGGGAPVLQSFTVGDDGSLTAAGTPVGVGSTSMGFFSISPDGGHVYASDYNGETLGGSQYSVNTYAIGADGALTFVAASPTGTVRPRTVSVAPNGRFLYAGDTSAAKLIVALIGADGVPGAFSVAGDWTSGEHAPLVFSPEAAPTAEFAARAASKPLTMKFSGATSTSPDGTVERYDWAFGDGGVFSSASSPDATHTFTAAGKYAVTLTAVNAGCSTKLIYNGQTTLCNGQPKAAKTVEVDTPPWITSLKVSPSKVSRRSKLKFKVTESATVKFKIQKPQAGRLVGGVCKKRTSRNRSAKKCTRWSTVAQGPTKKVKGTRTTTVRFTGVIKGRKLAKGRYRAYATAKDAAKIVGPAASAKFTIR